MILDLAAERLMTIDARITRFYIKRDKPDLAEYYARKAFHLARVHAFCRICEREIDKFGGYRIGESKPTCNVCLTSEVMAEKYYDMVRNP